VRMMLGPAPGSACRSTIRHGAARSLPAVPGGHPEDDHPSAASGGRGEGDRAPHRESPARLASRWPSTETGRRWNTWRGSGAGMQVLFLTPVEAAQVTIADCHRHRRSTIADRRIRTDRLRSGRAVSTESPNAPSPQSPNPLATRQSAIIMNCPIGNWQSVRRR
jgi:hypothetical protein